MSVTPSLVYDDAPAAIAWLTKAFAFEEEFRVHGRPGEVLYAELRLGNDFIMVETTPQNDLNLASPRQLGARTQGVCVQVDDVEAHLRTAEAAGARIVRPLEQTDHGLQYSAFDLEDHLWTFGTYSPGMSSLYPGGPH